MDMIAGPRSPMFPHVEVPLLCGPGPIPKESDYNKRTQYWYYKEMMRSDSGAESKFLLTSMGIFIVPLKRLVDDYFLRVSVGNEEIMKA